MKFKIVFSAAEKKSRYEAATRFVISRKPKPTRSLVLIHHMTAETFQLSLHKDQITAVEIKLIVVVGERHVASREVDQHQGSGRLRLSVE